MLLQVYRLTLTFLCCVSVHPRTPVLKVSRNGSIMSGEHLELTCKSDSANNSISYVFLKDGKDPTAGTAVTVNSSTIKVKTAGVYSCIAQFGGVNSSSSTPYAVSVVGKFIL